MTKNDCKMAFYKAYRCVIVVYLISFSFALDHPGGDTVNTYLVSMNSTLENLLAQYSVLQQEVATLKAKKSSSSVAFSVIQSASPQQLGSGQALRFDKVNINIGNGYNKYSGHFTAPVEGIYGFFVNIESGNSHALHVQVVKNGAEIARPYSAHIDDVASGSAIAHLQVGDIVWVRHMTGVTTESFAGSSYSSFSGVLIS